MNLENTLVNNNKREKQWSYSTYRIVKSKNETEKIFSLSNVF